MIRWAGLTIAVAMTALLSGCADNPPAVIENKSDSRSATGDGARAGSGSRCRSDAAARAELYCPTR